jgi:hypothetical protein
VFPRSFDIDRVSPGLNQLPGIVLAVPFQRVLSGRQVGDEGMGREGCVLFEARRRTLHVVNDGRALRAGGFRKVKLAVVAFNIEPARHVDGTLDSSRFRSDSRRREERQSGDQEQGNQTEHRALQRLRKCETPLCCTIRQCRWGDKQQHTDKVLGMDRGRKLEDGKVESHIHRLIRFSQIRKWVARLNLRNLWMSPSLFRGSRFFKTTKYAKRTKEVMHHCTHRFCDRLREVAASSVGTPANLHSHSRPGILIGGIGDCSSFASKKGESHARLAGW